MKKKGFAPTTLHNSFASSCILATHPEVSPLTNPLGAQLGLEAVDQLFVFDLLGRMLVLPVVVLLVGG